ncbi:endonuclease [Thalassotalea euphylliae]|uniref:endonuclease n=1 Tax=Thalassotalea euphylliae TaxID=1655234 RepID=UPI003624ED32
MKTKNNQGYLTKRLGVVFVALFSQQAIADIPSGYYDAVNASNASSLRASLHDVIDDHQRFPYTSSSTDTWDILEQADQNPDNATHVIDIYKNASYSKAGGGNSNYNREHSWPKSYGFPKDGSTNYAYTDAHQLFIADSSYNSSRSNKPYANCTSGCSEKVTQYNNVRGGGAGESNWTAGSYVQGSWQTWAGRKGDVARALMYMAVRYEGGNHGITGVSEPDLILTDNRTLIDNSNTGANISVAYMGLKSVLLQWHKDDPVDDFERRRNDAIYSFQGNRNPFIDRPEYVACVFESNCSDDSGGGGSTDPIPNDTAPWINEFHYDNQGSDRDEFVEIAGVAGTNLSGWKIEAYNGNGGKLYKTINLSGVISNQSNGYGALAFTATSLQNGSADGIALINAQGEVVQFISYEGTLTATNGVASGLRSDGINVSETSSTPTGYSLQLRGQGTGYDAFNWQGPSSSSRGSLNSGQTMN